MAMKYTVANLDPQLHEFDDALRQVLRDGGARLIEQECITEEQIIDFAANADAIIAARAPINRRVIAELKQCRVIARPGAGTDNVDHHAATERGVVVVYVPYFCTDEVADHAIMFLLACHKKLLRLDRFVRDGKWGFGLLQPLPSLAGQTLGLVGFGRIAQSVSRKARAFRLDVISYDPYVKCNVFSQCQVAAVGLEDLLRRSDYVSLHMPLTPETKGMIGAAQLSMMKPSAFLINCARGGVVDESALIKALQQRALAGAALDCLAEEPPPAHHPFFVMENVLLTPHSAAYSDGAIAYLREKTVRQIVTVLTGHIPPFVRNPEVLQKLELRK
jgi:D-3-phosphoglycerate dehydrogenase / 2-oxoglutarate reductase